MRKLVICEKGSAASRISTILSDGSAKRKSVSGVSVFDFERDGGRYSVIGLRGHLIEIDYPEEYNDWNSISIPELVKIDAIKIVQPSVKRILNALRKLSQDSDEIIIATDYDREGELIGVETLEELTWDRPVGRARFSALTRREILDAFETLVGVDYRLAAAAETRRIIDLKWGAALTRFLSIATGQTGKEYLSVGRVQSPTLAFIVDREREIEEFIPEPFWKIIVQLTKESGGETFQAQHAEGEFRDKDRANEIYLRVKKEKSGKVDSYNSETKEEYPPIPFNTTQFLAEANNLGITPAQAMRTAEELYISGYISYPRTDNLVYPKSLSLRGILNNLVDTEFGDYANRILSMDSIRPSRGKKSTTDHPPIYPTSAAKRDELKGNKWKIYELVCRRFLATVSPSSKVRIQTAELKIAEEPFIARGRELLEPGWREIYTYWRFDGTPIPELAQGELLNVENAKLKEDKTKPPTRYSQGTIIQKMEKEGIGTKSTRHDTVQKLYERKFVHGSSIRPTPIGTTMIVALENHADIVTNTKMTSHLEYEMDRIAKGETEQEDVIEESQAMLETIVETLQMNEKDIVSDIRSALKKQNHLGKCPKCGKGEMMIIRLRGGNRFIGCSNYPECNANFPVPAMGHIEPTSEICGKCNSPMVRTPERGKKAGNICINPECEENRRNNVMGNCPTCGGGLRLIFSSRGKRFLGCEKYPDCRTTFPLPQKGGLEYAGKGCDACGAPIVKIITKGRRPWILCVNPECPSKKGNNKEVNSGSS